jgi:bacteriocin-like protein
MKMQEMNYTELQEVNGGSIFGGNDSSSSNSGLLGGLGIDNLLSFQSASQNGDQSKASSFTLGNGITSSLGGIFGNSSSSI